MGICLQAAAQRTTRAPPPPICFSTSLRVAIEVSPGVVDASGELVGVITDGDLRRQLTNLATGSVSAVMTPAPKIIEQTASVNDALEMMRTHRVTVLFVVPEAGSHRPVGAVQIYDIASAPP